MGCVNSIRTGFTNFKPGGVWKYIGYDTVKDGLYDKEPAIPLFTNLKKNTILTTFGDDFNIVTEDRTEGYYLFEYIIPGEDVLQFKMRIVGPTIYSGDNNLSINHIDEVTVDLNDIVTYKTPGGVFTAVDDVGDNLNGSILTLAGLTPGETYGFNYSLLDGFEDETCEGCNKLISRVAVRVTSGLTGYISNFDSTIEYELKPYHPSTGVENATEFLVDTYAYYAANCNFKVLVDGQELTWMTGEERVAEYIAAEIGIRNDVNVFTIPEGSYIKQVVVQHSLTNVTSIVPTAPSTAVLTGIYGNINVNDLYINNSTINTFGNAIIRAIRYSLNDTRSLYRSTLTPVTGGFDLSLRTHTIVQGGIVHYGIIGYTVVKPDNTEVVVSFTSNGFKDFIPLIEPLTVTREFRNSYGQLTQCPGELSYKAFSSWFDVIFDKVNSTFNNLILLNQSLVSSTTDRNRVTCDAARLTAEIQHCGGTLTYAWRDSDGGGFASTQVVKVLKGETYYVKGTCSDGNTITLSITT